MNLEKLAEIQTQLENGQDPAKLKPEQRALLEEGLAGVLDIDQAVVSGAKLAPAELAEKFNTAVHYSNAQAEASKTLEEQKDAYDQDVVPECLYALNRSMASSDVLNRMAQSLNTRALMNAMKPK